MIKRMVKILTVMYLTLGTLLNGTAIRAEEPVTLTEKWFVANDISKTVVQATGEITGFSVSDNNVSGSGTPENPWEIGADDSPESVTAYLTGENNNKTLYITGTGAMKDYYYDDVPWDNSRDSINSLTIGEGVTNVGTYAVQNTKITSVTIPSSVTNIGFQAFAFCENLQSITITNDSGLTSIGDNAFSECTNLTSITIPSSVTSIGDEAFGGCSSLQSITFENNSELTSIGSHAFCSCKLTSVTIPSSVTSIGHFAFSSDDLETVTFERGTAGREIEINQAFMSMSGKAKVGYGTAGNTILFDKNKNKELKINDLLCNISGTFIWKTTVVLK